MPEKETRPYLVNITTRIVHSTSSERAECKPRRDDNIGYLDTVEDVSLEGFIFCSCTNDS